MTARPEFNTHVVALRFQKIASAEKDALWSIALIFGGTRHLAQTLLIHALGNAWKAISALASEADPTDEDVLRREIYVALAHTGLKVLTGKKSQGRMTNSSSRAGTNDNTGSLQRVNKLRNCMDSEQLSLLALSQYSQLDIDDLASLFGLSDEILVAKISEAREAAERILHNDSLG